MDCLLINIEIFILKLKGWCWFWTCWSMCHFKLVIELPCFFIKLYLLIWTLLSSCRDLLYKPIVLCKTTLLFFLKNTLNVLVVRWFSVFFPPFLQLVVTCAVSGVYINQWVGCANLSVQLVGINTITSQQSAKCFIFCFLNSILLLTIEGPIKLLVYLFL